MFVSVNEWVEYTIPKFLGLMFGQCLADADDHDAEQAEDGRRADGDEQLAEAAQTRNRGSRLARGPPLHHGDPEPAGRRRSRNGGDEDARLSHKWSPSYLD